VRYPRLAGAAGAATLGLVIAVSVLAWRSGSALAAHPGGELGHRDRDLALALLVACFVTYLCGLGAIALGGLRLGVTVAVAAAIQIAPLAAPLLASTDAWTYWDYGRLASVHGANPYADPPSSYPNDPAYRAMGTRWRERTSVYGPGFTLASEPLAHAAGSSRSAAAWVYKTLAAAAALAATSLAAVLARRGALAAAFVGWNPLLAVHFGGGGHNDVWIGALMLLALAAAATGRRSGAGAAWVVAVAIKWVPLVFLALRALETRAWRERRGVAGAGVAAIVIVALASWRYGWRWLSALVPLAEHARLETRYALPHRLQSAGLPRELALAIAAAVLAVGAVWLTRAAARGRARLASLAVLMLVTTPYLAVWYLGWALPLAAVDDDDRWARIAVLALSAYLLPQTLAF
jgi:hypothetical protein